MAEDNEQPLPHSTVIRAGAVMLDASVCEVIWRVLNTHVIRGRADGGHVTPALGEAIEALRAAAFTHMSANRHTERTFPAIGARSTHMAIKTAQLAAMLQVSNRHALRLAKHAGIEPISKGIWHREDAESLRISRPTPHRNY